MIQRFLNRIRLKGLPTSVSSNVLVVDGNGDIGINEDMGGDITAVQIQTDTGSGSKASDLNGIAEFNLLGGQGVRVTNVGTTITVAGENASDSDSGIVELATTGEADTGTDTSRAVTPAGLKSHVDSRYSYAYMTWSASAISTVDGSDPEWAFPASSKGVYDEDWGKDENIKATSTGTTTYEVTRHSAVNGFVVPHTGVCVGFHAHGRNNDTDASFKAGLFHLEGSTTSATNNGGVDYGNTGATNEATLRWIATADEAEASGGADGSAGHNFRGPCKLVSNTTALDVTPGDVLLPAIMGPDDSDEIYITMTIILKIPITS